MRNDSQNGRHALEYSALFRPLDEQTKHQLASQIQMQEFAAGETICHFGSPGQNMFMVLRGTVRIAIPSADGKQIVVTDLKQGEVFGEVAFFDGGPRSADAMALSNCELATLERGKMLPVLRQYPEACIQLLSMICTRLRRTDELMIDLLFFDLPARLAKVILSNAVRPKRAMVAKLSLSQGELANLVGGRRESVNRCLQVWQRLGIIELKRGWIVVVQPERLQQVAKVDDKALSAR